MPTYFVMSAAVLRQASRITAPTWDEAISLHAAQQQGSGQFVAVPVTALMPGRAALDVRPSATITPGEPV